VQELQEVTRKPGIKLKAVRVTAEAELDVCFGSKATSALLPKADID
jgi:hypothetical protein